ncbi:putative Restriction endonuclease [Azospirillaceae bacterium]
MKVDELFEKFVPINRKEAYYTATVLPGIVCRDNFAHFGRFLQLLGIEGVEIKANADDCNVQFFSEYNLMESIYWDYPEMVSDDDPLKKFDKVAPDIVVFISGPTSHLISIEAKMFDRPKRKKLIAQVKQQEQMINALEDIFKKRGNSLSLQKHFMVLLPEGYFQEMRADKYPVITWESVLDIYKDVAESDYFHKVLSVALDKLDSSKKQKKKSTKGQEIFNKYENLSLEYQYMGRKGGLSGKLLKKDIEEGTWKNQPYEVGNEDKKEKPNWFPVSEFIKLVRQNQTT